MGSRRRLDGQLLRDGARRLAVRSGRFEQLAELRSAVDYRYGRNRRDDETTRRLLPVALAGGKAGIDVGANIGEILEAMVQTSPGAQHLAFEPIPDLADDLRRRFPQVEVRSAACSDTAGEATFTVVVDTPALSGLRRREDVVAEDVATREIEVRLERLDDVVDPEVRVGFLKVDVEGAEVGVLRGAQELLRRERPAVVFEHGIGGADLYGSTSEELWDLLDDCGLQVFDLAGEGPFSRAAFGAAFASPLVWNWLAVAR